MQGAISLRQESYDRNVATGTLQQKMGRIAPYTQRYSAPLRPHPPVSFADSPPWQGGPRGLSNFATKCNLLPLLQEEAKEAVRRFNKQQLSPQNPVFINLTSMRRRAKEPAPHQYRCSAFRKQSTPTEASAHKQGVQGVPPWAFSVPFCAQKGTPRRIGGPSGEDTP